MRASSRAGSRRRLSVEARFAGSFRFEATFAGGLGISTLRALGV